MPARQVPVHNLRPNEGTWTPAAVIFLDSETSTVSNGTIETEQLRCWSADMLIRRHRRRTGELLTGDGFDSASCAAQVDAWASIDKSTWLYAHNLGFDLAVTELPARLAALGWQLSSRFAMASRSPWIVLHKGRQQRTESAARQAQGHRSGGAKWAHTLTLADSFSLMPVALAELASWTGQVKPPLPDDADSDQAWLERCRADVVILRRAVTGLIEWWEANDLGRWQVSGGAAGWSTYRHKMPARTVVIDPDPSAAAFERESVYGGRRDVMRYGSLPPGRYCELDFSDAYVTVAATQPLPEKRMGPLTPQIARSITAGWSRYGMVARCRIRTDQPRWPARINGRVFYPVGEFTTTLATPDLLEADAAGCLLSVGDGWFYRMGDHMRPWAEWVLQVVHSPDGQVPLPAKIMTKNIGRAVCGKWAQHGWSRTPVPGPPGAHWEYEDVCYADSAAPACLIGLAGQWYLSLGDQLPENAFPAVLAHIESHTRVRLGRVVDSCPPRMVVQCDTDGIMADLSALGHTNGGPWPTSPSHGPHADPLTSWLATAAAIASPLTMRPKSHYARIVMLGPQHAELDGRPRFSGVPRGAWASGEGQWSARLWPSLPWQLQHAKPGEYDRPARTYAVRGPYAPGWILADGRVRAAESALDESGSNYLLPWAATRWAAAGDQLAASQAEWSRGLWGQNECRDQATA